MAAFNLKIVALDGVIQLIAVLVYLTCSALGQEVLHGFFVSFEMRRGEGVTHAKLSVAIARFASTILWTVQLKYEIDIFVEQVQNLNPF